MKKGLVKKGLILGIITLLVAASVIPIISSSIEKNDSVKDFDTGIINNGNQIKKKSVSASSDVDWWPMFHHDTRHSGYSTSNAPKFYIGAWNFQTDGQIYASPVVVDNKVFIASSDQTFYCFNATSGERLWEFPTGGDLYPRSATTAAVVNDRVYFGAYLGYIYCLNATTGALIWIYAACGYTGQIVSAPSVVNNRVYIGTGGCNFSILCLDAEGNGDGTTDLIWKYTAADDMFSNSPTVENGKVYAGNDKLYCLSATNGSLLWNTTLIGFTSSPMVDDDSVYIGASDNSLYCFDANSGVELRNFVTEGEVHSTPAIAYDKVYFGSDDTYVYGLEKEDFDLAWKHKTAGNVRSSPAVADGAVFIGSNDNKLYCLDENTGEELWVHETDGMMQSSPGIANGVVYVGSHDKKIYAYRGGYFDGEFTKPVRGEIYLNDNKILSLPFLQRAWIIGDITLTVDAWDSEYGIKYVEFYLDEFFFLGEDYNPTYEFEIDFVIPLLVAHRVHAVIHSNSGASKTIDYVPIIKFG